MSMSTGFNPMRWKCEDRGCFNIKQRPKIEVFADCPPGKLAFSDIDAVAEVKGWFLFLEFKGGEPRDLPIGQKILYQQLTRASARIQVVVICADAETMTITHAALVKKGSIGPWEACSREQLRVRIKAWADKAQRSSPSYLRSAA